VSARSAFNATLMLLLMSKEDCGGRILLRIPFGSLRLSFREFMSLSNFSAAGGQNFSPSDSSVSCQAGNRESFFETLVASLTLQNTQT
jgi:hypothetical protein